MWPFTESPLVSLKSQRDLIWYLVKASAPSVVMFHQRFSPRTKYSKQKVPRRLPRCEVKSLGIQHSAFGAVRKTQTQDRRKDDSGLSELFVLAWYGRLSSQRVAVNLPTVARSLSSSSSWPRRSAVVRVCRRPDKKFLFVHVLLPQLISSSLLPQLIALHDWNRSLLVPRCPIPGINLPEYPEKLSPSLLCDFERVDNTDST